MRAIIYQGGPWHDTISVGIVYRYMSEASTNAWDIVASSNIQNTHYTDHHDVDEDVMAICKCGGGCYSHTEAGITQRAVFHPSDFLVGYIASLKNKD